MKKIKSPKNQERKEDNFPEAEFYGTSAVGTKGQIVIPKEARDSYDIKPGDKMVVFAGQGGVLALIKSEELNNLLKKLGKIS